MDARRCEHRIPGGLTIEVRVDVDEARGDDAPRGVDLAATLPGDGGTHLGDDPVGHGHIGREGRPAGAVDHRSITNDEIVRAHTAIVTDPEPPFVPQPSWFW